MGDIDSDGDFVVVWMSADPSVANSRSYNIRGQRYASDGSLAGDEFQINTYTTSIQGSPSVAMGADGNFVVVWHSFGSGGTDSSLESVQGQRYASDGSIVGGQFQINVYTTGRQKAPVVAADENGNFVVVWESTELRAPCQQSRQRYVLGTLTVNWRVN